CHPRQIHAPPQPVRSSSHDAGKRLLNSAPRLSPPSKASVYNRPWLIKNKKLPSRCTAHIPTETRQA
ncbi:MAG: hypothetical protein ACJ8HC_18015, partial [Paraburkholderia graminis]|uniref:hypothetical protein n=1 Tax=Paraburkholderia graminis TaxID=60548 RepID=UPI00389A4838